MTKTTEFVTVMLATPRKGWLVASREGDVITHKRLMAPTLEPETARTEAATLFPTKLVVMPDDPDKPWKR